MAAARAGQWKAVEFLYNRIYGRPTEHIVTEPPKARWKQEMDALSLEELEALRDRFRTEREREARKAVEPEEERSPRPPLGASKEEVFAWRREQPWYKDNKGKQLRAVQDEPDEEAV
jgi:hypothetical protein